MIEHANRIKDSLTKSKTSAELRHQKIFWTGFIVALADTGAITFEDYRRLCSGIDCWKVGDQSFKIVGLP